MGLPANWCCVHHDGQVSTTTDRWKARISGDVKDTHASVTACMGMERRGAIFFSIKFKKENVNRIRWPGRHLPPSNTSTSLPYCTRGSQEWISQPIKTGCARVVAARLGAIKNRLTTPRSHPPPPPLHLPRAHHGVLQLQARRARAAPGGALVGRLHPRHQALEGRPRAHLQPARTPPHRVLGNQGRGAAGNVAGLALRSRSGFGSFPSLLAPLSHFRFIRARSFPSDPPHPPLSLSLFPPNRRRSSATRR